ncbi:MAG: VCBS repeat-containing protein [Planctomycetes bacterium]|nr:VCBS repeat-containing protein [Planctomycetota bacterium]
MISFRRLALAALFAAPLARAQTHPLQTQPLPGDAQDRPLLGDFNGDTHLDCVVTPLNAPPVILVSRGDGSFEPARALTTTTTVEQSLADDLDGDGDLDLVLRSRQGWTEVWLGDGSGNFTAGPASGLFGLDWSILADVSGDGTADLVYHENGFALFVALGNGLGGFGAPSQQTTNKRLWERWVAGDFDGDADIDLAISTSTMAPGGYGATQFSNQGNGVFVALASQTGVSPLHALDLEGDGDDDLIVSLGSALQVLTSNGLGGFTAGPISSVSAGAYPEFADLDGDGDVDACWVSGNPSRLSTALYNGAGSFSTAAAFDAPLATFVSARDMNGDGRLDALLCGGNLGLALGLPGGGFEQLTRSSAAGSSTWSEVCARLGDVDNDLALDLASARATHNRVDLWTAAGGGHFAQSWSYSWGSNPGTPVEIELAHIDHDGRLDLVAALRGAHAVAVFRGSASSTFSGPTMFAAGTNPEELDCADLNGDGNTDLVVRGGGASVVQVLIGDGAGGFASAVPYSVGATAARSLALGDLTGDGKLDVAVGLDGSSARVAVLAGDGAGALGAPALRATSHLAAGPVTSIAIADLDLDGRSDLAVVHDAAREVALLYGVGSGNFTLPATYACAANALGALTLVDLDGDARLDLHLCVPATGHALRYAAGARAFSREHLFGTSTQGGARSMAAGDLDGDGRNDLLALANGGMRVDVALNRAHPTSTGCTLESYCPRSANSTNPLGAHVSIAGSLSVAHNGATLVATGLVPNVAGLAFFGPRRAFASFAAGTLCVGNLVRLGPPALSNAQGSWSRALDLSQAPLVSGPGAANGDAWHFQVWYRDAAGGHPSGINLTDAVQAIFCP